VIRKGKSIQLRKIRSWNKEFPWLAINDNNTFEPDGNPGIDNEPQMPVPGSEILPAPVLLIYKETIQIVEEIFRNPLDHHGSHMYKWRNHERGAFSGTH